MRPRRILLALAGAFGLAQLVPLPRPNPPIEQDVDAPAAAHAVLERSCYDCHSHATRWPWYAWVAPASWLLVRDVTEGREHLNFSTWGRYDEEERAENLQEIAEMLEKGEMPPWFYLPLHPDARLSPADLAAVRAWTGAADQPGRAGHPHRDHPHR